MSNKLFFFIIFTLATCLSVNGQILDQGNFLLGSSLGFSTSKSEVSKTENGVNIPAEGPTALQLSLAPKIGYFLYDDFVLGIGLNYTFSSVKEPDFDETDGSDLLFGPFLRYYFPLENDIAFFAEADFGFGNSSNNQVIAGTKQSIDNNVFSIGFGPGVTIFSNNGIGIEAICKYNYARSNFETQIGGVKTNSTTKSNQFDISLGVHFYFAGMRRIGS